MQFNGRTSSSQVVSEPGKPHDGFATAFIQGWSDSHTAIYFYHALLNCIGLRSDNLSFYDTL